MHSGESGGTVDPGTPGGYAALDAVPGPLGIADAHGLCLYANPELASLVGSSAEELVGRPVAEWLPTTDPDAPPLGLSHDPVGMTRSALHRARRSDGASVPVEVLSRRADGGQVWFSLLDRSEHVAGEALRQSELWFRGLVEQSLVGIYAIQDGRFSYVNPRFGAIFGYDAAEVVGMAADCVVAPEDRAKVLDRIRAIVEGTDDRSPYTFVGLRKDGTTVPVEMQGLRIEREDSAVVSGVLIDVSDRTEAEARAREREAYFGSLISQARDLVVVVDDGIRISFIGPSVRTLLGHEPEAVEGRSPADFVHPDDLGRLEGMIRVALGGEESIGPEELRLRHADGGWRLHEAVGSYLRGGESHPSRVVINSRDVTERREAAQNLQASEARFRALLENSSDIVMVAAVDGTILYLTPSVERALGIQAEPQIGRNLMERVHREDVPVATALLAEILQDAGAVVDREFRVRHADGSWRTLAVSGRNLLDHPHVGGIVLNLWDISVRKQLETQLRQSQKLEAVGRLAGGIAHDFNNLLTAIQGHAHFAMDQHRDDPTLQAELGEILTSVGRAASLTRQLLAFSRKQVLHPTVLDLNDVVRGMSNLFARLIGEDVLLKTELAPGLRRVVADRGQIEQILLNLAVNARDAMPAGGTLTVTTSNDVLTADSLADTVAVVPGRYVRLDVVDTGTGIPAEALPYLFEPFFTTKGPLEGTGLGLSTVYGVVKQSGGYVIASNNPDQGARFEIWLPATEQDLEADTPRPEVEEHVARPAAVLLVEDELGVRRLVERVLVRGGYRVVSAPDGIRALELLATSAEPLDMLITDLVMPRLNGQELAEKVRERHPAVRVLFMSGYSEEAVRQRGILLDDASFLEKPFTPAELERAVANVLAGTGS